MRLLRYSIMFFFILTSNYAFNAKECFSSDFDVKVKHKGWPFGLTDNVLNISKKKCDIYIDHERVKYLKSAWHIDICREPVHIKKGRGAVEVIRKIEECSGSSTTAFCSEISKVKENMQNDGLIFAEGSKETLSSDHGKVYCAYGLIKLYEKGHILGSKAIDKLNFLTHKVDKKDENKERESDVIRPIIEGQTDIIDAPEEDEVNDKSETSRDNESSTTRTF